MGNITLEQLGLITVAIVGQDGHDGMAGPELLGEADRARDVDAR